MALLFMVVLFSASIGYNPRHDCGNSEPASTVPLCNADPIPCVGSWPREAAVESCAWCRVNSTMPLYDQHSLGLILEAPAWFLFVHHSEPGREFSSKTNPVWADYNHVHISPSSDAVIMKLRSQVACYICCYLVP